MCVCVGERKEFEREECEVLLLLCCHCKSFYTHIQIQNMLSSWSLALFLSPSLFVLRLKACCACCALHLLMLLLLLHCNLHFAFAFCIYFAFLLSHFLLFWSVEIDHLPFSLRCALLHLSHIKMSEEQEEQEHREQRELLSELLRLLKALLTTLLQSPSQSQLAATPPKKKWIYRHYCFGMWTHTHAQTHTHVCA